MVKKKMEISDSTYFQAKRRNLVIYRIKRASVNLDDEFSISRFRDWYVSAKLHGAFFVISRLLVFFNELYGFHCSSNYEKIGSVDVNGEFQLGINQKPQKFLFST
jgi:hypothetical protein